MFALRFTAGQDGTQRRPIRAAAAAVCLQWFDCGTPPVMSVRAPSDMPASPTRNSSLRVLFPPRARPVRSSRLMSN